MSKPRVPRRGVRAKRTSDTNSARKLPPIKLHQVTATTEASAVATPESSPTATD
jgi:hypothetical protein